MAIRSWNVGKFLKISTEIKSVQEKCIRQIWSKRSEIYRDIFENSLIFEYLFIDDKF